MKIEPLKLIPLINGDIVQLGVPLKTGEAAEFTYKYCVNNNAKRSYLPMHSSSSDQEEQPLSKRMRIETSALMKQKLSEHEAIMSSKIAHAESELERMKAMLKEKESTEAKLLQELEEQRAQLEEEKQQLENELQQKLEEQLKQREDALRERLAVEKQSIVDEKEKIEKKLEIEMMCKLDEKKDDLKAELQAQMEKLEKELANKELKEKMLEKELTQTRSENCRQQEQLLKVKEDILENFTDLMEAELQCSICAELFIEATTLGCSHSFCNSCVEEWLKRNNICPNCRCAVTTKSRSIVLDSYIDQMVEHLSDDLKQRRKEIVLARKAEKKKQKTPKKATPTKNIVPVVTISDSPRASTSTGPAVAVPEVASTVTVQTSEHKMTTRSRSGTAVRANAAHAQAVLSSSSDESEAWNSSDEYESEGSVEGDPHAYYGGYGYCFRCGRRGHWANGCPERY